MHIYVAQVQTTRFEHGCINQEKVCVTCDSLILTPNPLASQNRMSEQRLALWNAEEDLEEEVDISMAVGSYGPTVYDDGKIFKSVLVISLLIITAHILQPQIDESTLVSMQQHMAQQAAFSQIPDVVKSVRNTHSYNMNSISFVLVYRAFSSSRTGQQPCGNNRCI